MGPIAQYLGTMQGLSKSFLIKWIDEHHKTPLAVEFQEKNAANSNHKKIKSSQLKSSLKVSILTQIIKFRPKIDNLKSKIKHHLVLLLSQS